MRVFIPKTAIPVFNGFYRVTPRGAVYRAKKGKGTWIGRKLKPYTPTPASYPTVSLHCAGKRTNITIRNLVRLIERRAHAQRQKTKS